MTSFIESLDCNDIIHLSPRIGLKASFARWASCAHLVSSPHFAASSAHVSEVVAANLNQYGSNTRTREGSIASTVMHNSLVSVLSVATSQSKPHVEAYTIKSRLGKGGQGDVWLATRNSTDTCVAIKWYPTEDVGGREAENLNALTKLLHPNVVRFIDSTNQALVMQYIEGLTLKEHLNCTNRHTLPWDEASVVMRGLLAGLRCLHGMKPPLLHRDVSTPNVMLRIAPVTNTAQVILVDFGLSKRTGKANQTQTVGQLFLGTLAYLAPEVGRVESKDHDARIDVSAAGVILYEMLGGQRPWMAPAGEELMLLHKISKEKHQRISNTEIGVNAFIDRAFEEKKEQRFFDAIEMLDVFEQVCKNPEEIQEIQNFRQMPSEKQKPRIVAFFVKRRDDIKIDVHKEAQTFTNIFANSLSSFELDIHAQPTFHAFSDAVLESRQRNIRILYFAGHVQDRCGFMWLRDQEARKYDKGPTMDKFAACL